MYRLLNKTIMLTMVTLCVMCIIACGNKDVVEPLNKENTNKANEEITSNFNQQENNTNMSEEVSNEASEVTSEFVRSETTISSIFYRSSTDIGSEISKEVKETLSEFNATTAEGGTKLTLPDDILFDFDSADLRTEADKVIKQLVEVTNSTDGDIKIIGHTDNRGKDDYNQKLSEDRAEAVSTALIDKGVDKSRITSEGKGASEPVAHNANSDGSDNPDGRQKNRRVEMIVQGLND